MWYGYERVEFILGETTSNCETSKLGRVSCEDRDEVIDLDGDDDLVPRERCLSGGEYDESVDDVVNLDLVDWRWSAGGGPFLPLTKCSGICGLGGKSGDVTDVLEDTVTLGLRPPARGGPF